MVGRLTSNSAAMCATVCERLPSSPVSSYIWRASLTCRGPSFGFCPIAGRRRRSRRCGESRTAGTPRWPPRHLKLAHELDPDERQEEPRGHMLLRVVRRLHQDQPSNQVRMVDRQPNGDDAAPAVTDDGCGLSPQVAQQRGGVLDLPGQITSRLSAARTAEAPVVVGDHPVAAGQPRAAVEPRGPRLDCAPRPQKCLLDDVLRALGPPSRAAARMSWGR